MALTASAWRREQVQPLLDAYGELDTRAVAVSGSVARGTADRWSDVEVLVLWDHEPARIAGGLDVLRRFDYDAVYETWSDDLSAHGLLVEVTHALVETVERRLYDFAGGIVDAEPVKGQVLFDAWRQRLREYPRERQLEIVGRTAPIEFFWRWEMHRDRGNDALATAVLADAIERVHAIRLALDRRYGPKLKSAPPYPSDPEAVRALVEETYDRIERELPEIDVGWLRRVFRHARRPVGP